MVASAEFSSRYASSQRGTLSCDAPLPGRLSSASSWAIMATLACMVGSRCRELWLSPRPSQQSSWAERHVQYGTESRLNGGGTGSPSSACSTRVTQRKRKLDSCASRTSSKQRHEHDEAEEQDRAHEGLLGGGDAVEVRLAVDGELEQHHEHRGELVEPVVAGRAGGRDAAAVEREESAREGEQHHGDDGHELGEVDHHAEDHEHERAERAEEVEEPHVPQEDEDHCEGVERARRVQGVGRGARPSQDAQHHRGGGDEVSEQPQHTPLVGAERAPQPDSALVDTAIAAGVAASHSHGNGEATQCEAA
eukprot:scaffold68733_cov63-Phaeocystis_antarctica.AAC.9